MEISWMRSMCGTGDLDWHDISAVSLSLCLDCRKSESPFDHIQTFISKVKVYFSQCAITKRSVCHSSFWIGFKVYRQSMIGRRELSLLAVGINSGVLLMFLWRHRTKRERENPLSLFHRFIFSFQSIRSLFVLFTLRRYPITVWYIRKETVQVVK